MLSDGARAKRLLSSTTLAGIITTIAGNGFTDKYGEGGYSGDGYPATSAKLSFPFSVAVDAAGNIYIADTYNNRIRMVTKSTGNITTIAGSGATGYFNGGYSGDGYPATAAQLHYPEGVTIDTAGNIYIADTSNHRIRMVSSSYPAPTSSPTLTPTFSPSYTPTSAPTLTPTYSPSYAPTSAPTLTPTYSPSYAPTSASVPTACMMLPPTPARKNKKCLPVSRTSAQSKCRMHN